MIIVGITGGIGSGKSVVSRIFRQLGIPVYDADAAARSLYERHPEVLHKLQEEFGETLTDAKGRLDRKKLASIVFQQEEKLKFLNRLVHPLVKKDFKEWAAAHRAAPYVMKEAAILFESGTHKDCDFVITVTAPTELRVQRVRSRDQRPMAEIRQVIASQWTDEEKVKRSQFVIQNDEDDAVLPQVLDIHEKILSASRERIQAVQPMPRS